MMRHLNAVLLLLCSLLPLQALELMQLHIEQDYVQPRLLLRLEITSNQTQPDLPLPLFISIDFFDGAQRLSQQRHDIHRWQDLVQGLIVHWHVHQPLQNNALRCLVRLHNAQQQTISSAEISRPSTRVLFHEFQNVFQDLEDRDQQHPLLRLRLEQAALVLRGAARNSELQQVRQWLGTCRQQLDGKPVPARNPRSGVVVARSDGSYQPYRLYLPGQKLRGVVVCCRDYPQATDKARWSALPEAWRQAAADAGLACLDIYPAGDRSWQGLAAQRINQSVAAAIAAEAELDIDTAWYLFAVGRGAHGALRAAMEMPQRYRALYLHQGQLMNDRWWQNTQALHAIRHLPLGCSTQQSLLIEALSKERQPGQRGLLTRIELGAPDQKQAWQWLRGCSEVLPASEAWQPAHFSQRPFLCIMGTGANLAARQELQDILHSLRSAWVSHSHGSLPLQEAEAVQLDQYPTHNLIFIGKPLDNKCLAAYLESLDGSQALRWDERRLYFPGGSILHSQLGSLQWRLEHAGRLIHVLAGPDCRLPPGRLPLQQPRSILRHRNASLLWQTE